MDTDWQDRQHRETRAHIQRPLEPIICRRHGPFMPRHIADGDCPACYLEQSDSYKDTFYRPLPKD